MNNFWNLVWFEYKKVLCNKTFFVGMICCVGILAVVVLTSANSDFFRHMEGGKVSRYEANKMDKAVIVSNAGNITPELVKQAINSNRELKSNDDNYLINEYGKHLKPEAYIKYVLPYELIVPLLNVIYEKDVDNISKHNLSLISVSYEQAIDELSAEVANHFDADLKQFCLDLIPTTKGLTQKEIAKHTEFVNQIEFPLYNDYYGGYEAYSNNSKGISILVFLVILIVLSPIFAKEYEEKTLDLILSFKNGKKSLCKAKLFVAITFSAVLSLAIMVTALFSFFLFFGFEGGNVNWQVLDPSSTYSLTLSQLCIIHLISMFVASILFGIWITYLSAIVQKKAYPVVIIGALTIVLPIFFGVFFNSNRVLHNISLFLPSNAAVFGIDNHFFGVFGTLYKPYEFVWTVSVGLIILGACMAICAFKNHQAT